MKVQTVPTDRIKGRIVLIGQLKPLSYSKLCGISMPLFTNDSVQGFTNNSNFTLVLLISLSPEACLFVLKPKSEQKAQKWTYLMLPLFSSQWCIKSDLSIIYFPGNYYRNTYDEWKYLLPVYQKNSILTQSKLRKKNFCRAVFSLYLQKYSKSMFHRIRPKVEFRKVVI